MTNDQIGLISYLFFCGIRIPGFRRRWSLPLMHGENFFLGVRVTPGFYTGPGAAILHRYRTRLWMPHIAEAALVAAILASGHALYLAYLIIPLVAVLVFYYLRVVRWAQRDARAFEAPEGAQPVSSISVSLTPRAAEVPSNYKFDLAIALVFVASLAAIAWYHLNDGAGEPFRDVWGKPILLLYLEAGCQLAKRSVIAWRIVMPAGFTEAYQAFGEERRRYYLAVCDGLRAWWAICLAGWALRFYLPVAGERAAAIYLAAILGIGLITTLWMLRRLRGLMAVAARTTPVKIPSPLEGAKPRGPLCFRPGVPVMMIRGVNGYALNLASARTLVWASYCAGLAAVAVWI